jgi:HSP20 family protein
MRIVSYAYPTTRSFAPALGFFGRSPWSALDGEIDRLLGNPRIPVTLHEDKDKVYLRAELPGVNREDITVEVSGDNLALTAVRKDQAGGSEQPLTLTRTISLPEDVDAEKAAAACQNGVLTVTLPKREQAKPHRIAVS